MSELEDRISGILSNPEEMERITNIAKSIMGGEAQEASGSGEENAGGVNLGGMNLGGMDLGGLLPDGIDPKIIASLGRLMSSAGGGDEKHALLGAMKPYMSLKRREKMERALQIARLSRLAGAAFAEFGGGT